MSKYFWKNSGWKASYLLNYGISSVSVKAFQNGEENVFDNVSFEKIYYHSVFTSVSIPSSNIFQFLWEYKSQLIVRKILYLTGQLRIRCLQLMKLITSIALGWCMVLMIRVSSMKSWNIHLNSILNEKILDNKYYY